MTTPDQRAYRLSSLDFLRGLVIAIMAIDHVRDFFHAGGMQDPMNDPDISPALFFTRWITHFCAPVFVLLAGTSAGLMAARKTQNELASFLLKRGLWLIAIEFFVIATAFTFAPFGLPQFGGRTLVAMQVIWAIGGSMVVLAGAQYLGRRACLAIGVALLVSHNLLDGVWPQPATPMGPAPLWVSLYAQMSYALGPFMLIFAYPILPWIGVMLVGYGIAGLFERPAIERNRSLRRWGIGLTVAWVVLRLLDAYGDPNTWIVHPESDVATLLDFLNTTKYPPSLSFLLMTLGPMAILASYVDRFGGWWKDALVMFGRVPFAFYVAHFFLIHALSVVLGTMQGFEASQFFTIFFFYPQGYGIGLLGVYAVWALVMVLLYPLCRWVAAVKARRRDWWLSYV